MGADERAVPASGAGGRHGPFRILRVDDERSAFPRIPGHSGCTGTDRLILRVHGGERADRRAHVA